MLTFINGAPVTLRPGYNHRDFGDFLRSRGQLSDDEYNYFTTTVAYRHDILVQLFYEGFHKHAGQTALQMQQTFKDKYLLLGQKYYRHIKFLRLNEMEKRFLQGLDGQRKLAELIAEEPDCPLLLTLTSLNMARFATVPTPSAEAEDLPLRSLFNAVEEEMEVAAEETFESFSDLVDQSDAEDITVSGTGVKATQDQAATAAKAWAQKQGTENTKARKRQLQF